MKGVKKDMKGVKKDYTHYARLTSEEAEYDIYIKDGDTFRPITNQVAYGMDEDCISRQAVLNILDDMVKDYIKENDFDKAQGVAWVKAQKLPSVTPQPKTGMWIEHFDESGKWYECDQCHTDWGGPVNYCPNCGARMEGDKR